MYVPLGLWNFVYRHIIDQPPPSSLQRTSVSTEVSPKHPPTNPLPPLRHRTKPMPSMPQNLLAELFHAVFKNLRPAETEWASGWPMAQEVRESLSACSLVCRSWHPIAREHLFRGVVFSFDSDGNQNLSTELSEEEDARWVEAPAHRRELCWYRIEDA